MIKMMKMTMLMDDGDDDNVDDDHDGDNADYVC